LLKDTHEYETQTPKRKVARKQLLQNCIFCEGNTGKLHSFTTLETDKNVRKIATTLGDFALLSRIAGGDLVAIEGKYHMSCITTFRNRYRSYMSKTDNSSYRGDEEKMKESRAMLELLSYINSAVDDGTLVFTLSELHSLYVNRLKDLGIEKQVNKTRLKAALLEKLDAQEQNDGKNTIIVFEEGMKNMLKDAVLKRDFMDDASIMAKAASIIRQHMFCHEEQFKFSGSFTSKCQEDSVPASLKSLIAMIINGTNLKDQEKHDSQSCLTISQTILFNSKKKENNSKSTVQSATCGSLLSHCISD
jgi:hypothetical protein